MQGEKREADRLDVAIVDAVSTALEGEVVSKTLEKAVAECMEQQVKNLFSWNGPVCEVLAEKLSDVMTPVIEGHDFGDYAVKLDRVLGEVVESSCLAEARKSIEAFRGLVAGDGEEHITFDALFAAYGRWVAEKFDCTGRDVEDGGYSWLEIACEAVAGVRGFFDHGYETYTVTFSLDGSDADDDQAQEFARVVELYRWGGAYPLPQDGGWYVRDTWKPTVAGLSSLSEFDVLVMRLARYGSSLAGEPRDASNTVQPEAEPELAYV